MNVVVLAGGLSTERNVSFSTGVKICEALKQLGHKAALVDLFLGLEDYPHPPEQIFDLPPALPSAAIGDDEPDLQAVKNSRKDQSDAIFGPGVLEACQRADVVFLGLHGQCGEDGRVQAAFDLMGIPYTGSGYLGSAIAMDKNLTKRLVRTEEILTPDWDYLTITEEKLESMLASTALPAVVKVPTGGSSIGVAICKTPEELRRAYKGFLGQEVLVEEYIEGREFSCGILGEESLPPIEILPKEGFYDYKNKYQPGAALDVCPAPLSGEEESRMRSAARRVHRLLGLSCYSRSDFRMTKTGKIYFLEVNTLPGMTPTSLLPQEAAAVGIDYPTLCQTLLDMALQKKG